MSEQYPARLVISRPPTKATPEVFVLVDNRTLGDAAELAQRQRIYQGWAAAMRTTDLYTFTVAPAAEAQATAARIRAELANKNGAKGASDTPAPELAPTSEDPTQGQYTPTFDLAQVKTFAPVWGGPGVELVTLDGRRVRRLDLSFGKVEAQAKAEGWRAAPNSFYMSPAIDWAELDRLNWAAWEQAHPQR
jgi:hypothetical protein